MVGKTKRNIFILILILFIIGGLCYAGYYFKLIKFGNEEEEKTFSDLLPKIDCSVFNNDEEIILKATLKGDINFCSCLKDNSKKEDCELKANDVAILKVAQQQCDASRCEEISNEKAKETCRNQVNIYTAGMTEQQLASCVDNNGNYDEAILIYENLLIKEPENDIYKMQLAIAYSNKALLEHKEELFTKAISSIENILENNQSSQFYRVQGDILEAKGDLTEALNSYNKAIEKDESNVTAYIGRGHVYNMLGALDNALNDFLKGKELDTNNEYIEVNSNICRLASTREDKYYLALESCKFVVESSRATTLQLIQNYSILGGLYMKQGDNENALYYYKKAEIIDPNNLVLKATIAEYYNKMDLPDKSLNYSNKILEQDPTMASGYLNYAYSMFLKSEYTKSIQKAEKGLTLVDQDDSLIGPNKGIVRNDFYYVLSEVYRKEGNISKADEYKQKISKN